MTASAAPVALRAMGPADVPAVMEIERALFPDDAWSERMVREELTAVPETRYYLVASGGETIVGYAGLAVIGDQSDVMTIAVRSGDQGHGVGRALLTELITEAATRRAAELFLEVRHDNAPAKRLYHRMGFVEIGVRRGYYNGVDAITMRRALTTADRRAVRGEDT